MTGVDFSVFVDKKVLGDERPVLKNGAVRSIPERENRGVIEMSDSLMLSNRDFGQQPHKPYISDLPCHRRWSWC